MIIYFYNWSTHIFLFKYQSFSIIQSKDNYKLKYTEKNPKNNQQNKISKNNKNIKEMYIVYIKRDDD